MIKTSAVAPEHRVVTAPVRVFDDQADFLAAFGDGELDTDLIAVLRYQGPRANGMPELHKLTPALGVLQDRGHKVALITDGRMSGASGKVPAAIHLTPEAAAGGPIARLRDGDLVTLDAVAGGSPCTCPTPSSRRARSPVAPRTPTSGSAPAANCSRTCARSSVPPTRAPASSPVRMKPGPPDPSNPGDSVKSLLDIAPVIPVVVIDDFRHAVRSLRRSWRGGVPVIELTLRTPSALDAIERIAAEVPDILVGAGTIVRPEQAKQAADAGAQFLVSPGHTPSLLSAMTDTGLPHLPGVATVSEVLTLLEAGYTEMKFFPAEAAGGAKFLASIPLPGPGGAVLPDRWHHPRHRAATT